MEALALAALISAASPIENRYGLPAGLLVAVVLVESGGRPGLISRRRYDGCRDYGAGQIHACNPSRRRLGVLLALSTNLDRAGQILAGSRERCRARPRWAACRRSEWALYNAGSSRWWSRVLRRWRTLRLPGGVV